MTLNQLYSLDEQELALLLYIVNVINPLDFPKLDFQPRNLTWFKHDMLIKKLTDAFPRLNRDGHELYVSMLEKLGVKFEIKYEEPKIEISQPVSENISNSALTPTASLEPEINKI